MGKIFAQMGMMYAWASPDYMLDAMSLDLIFMYYDYGVEALTGRRADNSKLDLEKITKRYGRGRVIRR